MRLTREQVKQRILDTIIQTVRGIWDSRQVPMPVTMVSRRFHKSCTNQDWHVQDALNTLEIEKRIIRVYNRRGACYLYPKEVWDGFDSQAKGLQMLALDRAREGRPKHLGLSEALPSYFQPKSMDELDKK